MKICHTCGFEETTSKEKNSKWGAATLFVSWPTFLFHSLEQESLGFHMLSKHQDWLKVCINFDKIWIFHMAYQYNFCERGNYANIWTWGKWRMWQTWRSFFRVTICYQIQNILWLLAVGKRRFFFLQISLKCQNPRKTCKTFIWVGLLTV